MNKCQQKTTYTSRADAKRVARKIKNGGKSFRIAMASDQLRPYKCSVCGWWHLTSWSTHY